MKILKDLEVHKTQGPVGISLNVLKVLKVCEDMLDKLLEILFKMLLERGRVPKG